MQLQGGLDGELGLVAPHLGEQAAVVIADPEFTQGQADALSPGEDDLGRLGLHVEQVGIGDLAAQEPGRLEEAVELPDQRDLVPDLERRLRGHLEATLRGFDRRA